ncbi:hypothetical protein AGIG_G111 [Arapaima gigas]
MTTRRKKKKGGGGAAANRRTSVSPSSATGTAEKKRMLALRAPRGAQFGCSTRYLAKGWIAHLAVSFCLNIVAAAHLGPALNRAARFKA